MNYVVLIIGVFFIGKDNYLDLLRKNKHTLVFNFMWDGICEGEDDVTHEKPTTNKELAIWKIEIRRLIH